MEKEPIPVNLGSFKDDVVNEAFKGALEGLEEAFASNYVKRDEVAENQTFDEGPWQPSEVLSIVPELAKLKVELIGPQTDLNKIHKHLIKWRNVGLILMGSSIGRNSKPLLILLTTCRRIFAIDPEDRLRSMKFLEMKLKDLRVNFWTSNGLWEADCLYNNYGINLLAQPNMNCCTAEHINIMKTVRALSKLGRALYPDLAEFTVCKSRNLKLPTFESMVEIWLDLDQKVIAYEPEQLCNLSVRPLNITAINLIKKRCSLVLALSERLCYFAWKQNQVASQKSFSRLIMIENNKLRKHIRDTMANRSDPQVDPALYDHLDNGCG